MSSLTSSDVHPVVSYIYWKKLPFQNLAQTKQQPKLTCPDDIKRHLPESLNEMKCKDTSLTSSASWRREKAPFVAQNSAAVETSCSRIPPLLLRRPAFHAPSAAQAAASSRSADAAVKFKYVYKCLNKYSFWNKGQGFLYFWLQNIRLLKCLHTTVKIMLIKFNACESVMDQ